MNKKEIIKMLEKDFLEYHKAMDKCNEMHDQSEAAENAKMSCYICKLLGKIHNTGEDTEMERLYNKYKLWRIE